jgi:DNA (cytosine-5)-methyltransferase 1
MKDISSIINKIYSPKVLETFASTFETAKSELENWTPRRLNNSAPIDVIDFFSGCGGMSIGFSAIGQSKIFNLIGSVDINQNALNSYSSNFKCKTLNSDIRDLCNEEGLELIRKEFNIPKKKKKPLVIIGCAPCQGFTAHRKKHWHKDDERNTLIGAFTETAIKLDPDFVVMENVPEILGKKYWEHYDEARQVFEENGYSVKQTIYNSAVFGVPQARNRAIIIASKINFELPLPLLDEPNFKTVRDAISDLPAVKAGETTKTDKYHRSARHKASTIETISKVPKDGGKRPNGVGPKCLEKVNGFSDVYGRLYWDKPSITLTQYSRNPASGRFTHPEQNRGLTIREAARIQSFPDTYEFQGSLDHCFKQIGESVPPLLSIAIASQILRAFASIESADTSRIESIHNPVKSTYSSQMISEVV